MFCLQIFRLDQGQQFAFADPVFFLNGKTADRTADVGSDDDLRIRVGYQASLRNDISFRCSGVGRYRRVCPRRIIAGNGVMSRLPCIHE
jgi:hypothetical protein